MKRIFSYIFLGLLPLFFVGCWLYGLPKSKYYVHAYHIVDGIVLQMYYNCDSVLSVYFNGDEILKNSREHEEFAEYFGDNHFNEGVLQYAHTAIINEFTGVDIISDTDFNSIPAGESLGGVIRFMSMSPYIYIQSGYKYEFSWTKYRPKEFTCHGKDVMGSWYVGYHPVNKMISELTAEDLKMLDPGSTRLRFMEFPAIKPHTFTVTFYDGDKEFSNTVKVTFP